jgi:hypothetical protein
MEPIDFKSDFLLEALNFKSKSRPGLATWHKDTDPAVHDLFDGYRTEPVTYTRVRNFDGKYQDCKVVKEEKDDTVNIVLLPGDGTRYSVKRVSSINKINDEKTEDSTNACVICAEYVKNHASIPCGHLITCTRCTLKLEGYDQRCPMCRVPHTQLLRIFS